MGASEAAAKEADAAAKAEEESTDKLKKLIGKEGVDDKSKAADGKSAADGSATSDGNAASGNTTSEGNGDGVNGTADGAIGGEVGDGVKQVEQDMEGLKKCQ